MDVNKMIYPFYAPKIMPMFIGVGGIMKGQGLPGFLNFTFSYSILRK